MRTSVKLLPLVFLLCLPILFVSADNRTFMISYEIPGGYANDIRISYDPDEPFQPIQVDEFPKYFFNYTVKFVGWLDVSLANQTGTRPVITINSNSVYGQIDPFYREKVEIGDLLEIKMVPPKIIESSHKMIQDDTIVTKYVLYSWEDMSGLINFTSFPRPEIIPDFTYSPMFPVEDVSLSFIPIGITSDINYVFWEIRGTDLYEKIRRTRYVSPRLEAGHYNVTLTFVDDFGYSTNFTKSISVKKSEEIVDEPRPSFASYDLSDVSAPSSLMINERFDVNLTLDSIISSPMNVRFRVFDVESNSVLFSKDEFVEVNGSKPFSLSLLASPFPRPMLLRVDVYHLDEGTWVVSDSSPAFTVDLDAPEQDNVIPGFPFAGSLMGLIVVVLLKRRFSAGAIPSP